MIDQGLVERITRLPAREQLTLIEVLTRSLREELPEVEHAPPADAVAIVDRLFGVLQTDQPLPADAEMNDAYTEYLTKKYS